MVVACVTGCERRLVDVLARIDAACPDVLSEVRLDLLDDCPVEDWSRALEGKSNILLALRPEREGGRFAGAEGERLGILRRCLDVRPAWLDVEMSTGEAALGSLMSEAQGTRFLVSSHPAVLDRALARDVWRRMIGSGADGLKIAVPAASFEDLEALLDLPVPEGRTCVKIGTGPAGAASRMLAAAFGSGWSYVAAATGLETASGQIDIDTWRRWRLGREDMAPIGLIGGEPVHRSPGPRVYNDIFARRCLPFVYVPLETSDPDRGLRLAWRLGFCGLSVTTPHKVAVAELLGDASGTVNTLVRSGSGWRTASTDGPGALRAIERVTALRNKRVVILGSGGASRAAADAVAGAGAGVEVRARSHGQPLPFGDLDPSAFDVLVNATPSGGAGEAPPCDPAGLAGKVVLDMVLVEGATRLVREARSSGASVLDGLDMWVEQGAMQMEIITGERIGAAELAGALVRTSPVDIRCPSSKSVTQRALVIAALSRGRTEILDPLDCEDTAVLRRALRRFGTIIEEREDRWIVTPGPLAAPVGAVDVGEAGTAARFVSALSLVVRGPLVVDGAPGMRRRPMHEAFSSLERLGMGVESLGRPGFLPVRLERRRQGADPRVSVSARTGSQHVSALLLVAPCMEGGLELAVEDGALSRPYIDLTIAVMREAGVVVEVTPTGAIRVPPTRYIGGSIRSEADWSSAAFIMGAASLTGRRLRLTGLSHASAQGDRVFEHWLGRLGGPAPRVFDASMAPDLVPPLVSCALFAAGRTEIRGAPQLRGKESDRIAVLARELSRAGAGIGEIDDGLVITHPPDPRAVVELDPHGDHRMAMAFGLVGLRVPGVRVLEQGCVAKSFPDFWSVLDRFREGVAR